MTLHQHDPLQRFTGLAKIYAQCRPTYPASAIDYIINKGQVASTSLLVDVGSGTGISSRLFAERGVPVVGIEPNDEMRKQAAAVELTGDVPRYQAGRAEATGLPEQSADVVLAAQAFHWFEPELAFREFQRILKPGGWVALMWNERDETDAFTAAYGDVIRTAPRAKEVEGNRGQAGAVLLTTPLFEQGQRATFGNEQRLDEEGMIGRALSASYAPQEPDTVERFVADLQRVFAEFQHEGHVVIRYETSLYLARKSFVAGGTC